MRVLNYRPLQTVLKLPGIPHQLAAAVLLTVLVSLMGSSFLSEVDNTSILRTGALHRYHYPLTWPPASRLLLPRSGLERSDFVLWHIASVSACSNMSGVGGRPEVAGQRSKWR